MRKRKKFRWLAGIMVACMLFGGMTAFARAVDPVSFSFGFERAGTQYVEDAYWKGQDSPTTYLNVTLATNLWRNVSIYVMHCNSQTLRPDAQASSASSYNVGTYYIPMWAQYVGAGGYYKLAANNDSGVVAVSGYWKP